MSSAGVKGFTKMPASPAADFEGLSARNLHVAVKPSANNRPVHRPASVVLMSSALSGLSSVALASQGENLLHTAGGNGGRCVTNCEPLQEAFSFFLSFRGPNKSYANRSVISNDRIPAMRWRCG